MLANSYKKSKNMYYISILIIFLIPERNKLKDKNY